MGGPGSGRQGWRTTVESALQLNIDTLVRRGVVRLGRHADGAMKFQLDGDGLAIEFEVAAVDPKNSWIRLKYTIRQHAIEDEFRLTTTRPHFGGLRWLFRCPATGRRVRKLFLRRRRFRSRTAHELVYTSQQEDVPDRAARRARKIRRKLGGDPADDGYPEKPPRMRWATYARLVDKLIAADRAADEWGVVARNS
jgi:hypothetical protein